MEKLNIDEDFLLSLDNKELIGIIKIVKYNYITLKNENDQVCEFFKKKIIMLKRRINNVLEK